MNSRNTKQKQLVIEILQANKNHPTIYEIYSKAQELEPNIGIATIYRNVNKLVDEKRVKRISVEGDISHYDGNINPHNHLICTKCKKVIDLFDNDYNSLIKNTEDKHSIKIETVTILFKGICKECNSKINKQ